MFTKKFVNNDNDENSDSGDSIDKFFNQIKEEDDMMFNRDNIRAEIAEEDKKPILWEDVGDIKPENKNKKV